MHDDTPPRNTEVDTDELNEVIYLEDNVDDDDDDDMDQEPFNESSEEELEESDDFIDEEIPDESILTFKKHSAAVFSCCQHPKYNLTATGGEDDRTFVWHTKTGDLLYEITTHSDTVIKTCFSHDGTYLATGDMAGNIMVYKLNEQIAENIDNRDKDEHNIISTLFELVWEHTIGDMTWLHWHYASNVLFASGETGEIYMWRIPAGDCKIMPGANVRCENGALTEDGKKLFAAYADGSVKLWDLKLCKTIMQLDAKNPQNVLNTITALTCAKDSPFYIVGDENGSIIFCTHNGYAGHVKTDGSVERIAIAPASSGLQVCVSGTVNGQITVWDYARHSVRCLCEQPEQSEGITAIEFINDFTFVVATLGGNIHGFDVRSGKHKFQLQGHHGEIYELLYNKKDNTLLSVSEDKTARIFVPPVD